MLTSGLMKGSVLLRPSQEEGEEGEECHGWGQEKLLGILRSIVIVVTHNDVIMVSAACEWIRQLQ